MNTQKSNTQQAKIDEKRKSKIRYQIIIRD